LSVVAFASSNGSGTCWRRPRNIVAPGRAKREQAIMGSAPNRHAPIALQHPSQSAYFHSLVRRFVGRVTFGLSDGADTTQPPF
jgi:hypothetical protein